MSPFDGSHLGSDASPQPRVWKRFVAFGIGAALPLWLNGALFVLGWIFQFIGHKVYEHKNPAFFRNESADLRGFGLRLARTLEQGLADALGDPPAVLRLERNDLEEQELQGALNEIGWFTHRRCRIGLGYRDHNARLGREKRLEGLRNLRLRR